MPINNKEIFKVGNSENNNFQMLSTFLSSQLDLAKHIVQHTFILYQVEKINTV